MPEFGAPLWLALLPLPPLLLWWWGARPDRDRAAGALVHPLAALIGELQGARRWRGLPSSLLWLCGCLLLILAMARPQWPDPDAAARAPGHDVVFAVDVSGSMRAMDYVVEGRPVSRLEMLRQALGRFLERASGLRAALLVFADDALTLMPLTADLALAARMTGEIDASLAGERTAIGDAIALAVRRMDGAPGEARVLVLLTDGADTAGTVRPDAAAVLAREHGVRIYTVGFGGEGSAPFPLGNGELVYRELPLDEGLLQSLAQATGGAYFRVRDAADMDGILDHIRTVELARIPAPAQTREGFWLPAVLGLLCLVLAEYRRQRELAPA